MCGSEWVFELRKYKKFCGLTCIARRVRVRYYLNDLFEKTSTEIHYDIFCLPRPIAFTLSLVYTLFTRILEAAHNALFLVHPHGH